MAPDHAGRYDIRSLPAGDYFVAAVPSSQRTSWQFTDYLEALTARASQIRVDWGETATQDLTLVQVVRR